MVYIYKDAFSLRDKIGTCPNTEIDIDIMDKTSFFIRPYHVREEDKRILDKGMKIRLPRNIEGRFFSLLKSSNAD